MLTLLRSSLPQAPSPGYLPHLRYTGRGTHVYFDGVAAEFCANLRQLAITHTTPLPIQQPQAADLQALAQQGGLRCALRPGCALACARRGRPVCVFAVHKAGRGLHVMLLVHIRMLNSAIKIWGPGLQRN